jgi:glycosyltransferase involved in cell wall biosynthesis
LKILLLSQFFSTTRGGGEYVFSLIAKNLAENGHEVFVITNKIENEKYSEYKNLRIILVPPTIQYKGGLPPSFSDNISYTINALVRGLKIIKSEKIDIIHSNNFAPALAGSFLSWLTSTPHITTVHDVFSLCGRNYWNEWGKQADISKLNVMLAPFFERLMIRLKHNCTHTVSEATRDDLIKFGEKRPIHVIHNSVLEQNRQNIETNPNQFVYVGRLVFYKNLEVVIKAINIIKDIQSKVKLIIAGDGPHRKTLESLVEKLDLQDHVEFKGYVSSEEKTKTIATSHALVFPSMCEGFGLVILEAFAQGRPVLVSNIRPLSDIVTHNVTGFVLDPHDENVWAEHMIKIMNEPQQTAAMGNNGNALLASKYSQEAMYQNIIRMYESVKRKKS